MTPTRLTAELAPYALIRVAALPHPGPAPSDLRAALDAVVAAEARISAMAGDLADALHDSAGTHSPEFHRRVVLPLRRAVHNGRAPRPAELGTLPDRVPLLAHWLDAHAALATALDAVREAWPADLAASRAWLAEVCSTGELRRASVLTGVDLLHGVDRTAAGRGEPDRKARKAEATVLRYALRATAKTSPLSWYTHVGWGTWADGPWPAVEPVSHPAVNRLLPDRIVAALGPVLPHRLAPGLRERDGRVLFRRDIPVTGGWRALVTKEEEVDVAATGPLRFVIATVRAAGPAGMRPEAVAEALAARLSTADAARAVDYVAKMRDIGLLVPVSPIDPQAPDAIGALADWLRSHDDTAAAELTRLAETTAAFGTADPPTRARTFTHLAEGWRAVGERLGADLSGIPPVVEDVLLPEPIPVPPGASAALARLTPLLVAFDQQVLLRRLARTRFVEWFGEGGTASLADCAVPLGLAWRDATRIGDVRAPEVLAVLDARAKLADQVHDGTVTDHVLAT
ncbi:MAG: hypothetical protein HOY78_08340, partial [Saccharothrix sp.]|nr:hypothetical protein [Saccharothrix sp.]